MMVNFMGLTGPLSALPLYYTEYVTERLRNRDTALRDFFDIFNHRMISLFYRAWEKHQFASPLTGASASPLTPYVLDLVGLGTPGLNDRQDVPDDALAYYSGLLAMHSRSATALEGLIEDYFQIPAKVEDFIGVWRKLDSFNQCLLEEDDSCGLGTSAVIGDEIFDHSRVRIRIGPLTRDQYRDFLPGGEAHRAIRALTKAFSSEVEYELQLVLQGQDVAGCVLETEANARPLGWLTWIRSNPDSASDARDDTLLLLE